MTTSTKQTFYVDLIAQDISFASTATLNISPAGTTA
jgi:hypothetical protein